MNYNIQQTSLAAWDMIQPDLAPMRKKIYDKLKELGEATNAMLAYELKLDACHITGRILELRQAGYVIHSRTGKCPITKNTAHFWKVSWKRPI